MAAFRSSSFSWNRKAVRPKYQPTRSPAMALGDSTLKAAGATVALLPGVAAILGGIDTPPGTSKWFGGVAAALGTLTVLCVWSLTSRIRLLSSRSLLRTVLAATATGIAAIVGYVACIGWCVYSEDRQVVYYPIVATGNVAAMIEQAGGRLGAIHRYGAWAVIDAISEHRVALALTSGLLVILYGTISIAFSAALLVPAVRLEATTKSNSPT
jgi:hypothetical protein